MRVFTGAFTEFVPGGYLVDFTAAFTGFWRRLGPGAGARLVLALAEPAAKPTGRPSFTADSAISARAPSALAALNRRLHACVGPRSDCCHSQHTGIRTAGAACPRLPPDAAE